MTERWHRQQCNGDTIDSIDNANTRRSNTLIDHLLIRRNYNNGGTEYNVDGGWEGYGGWDDGRGYGGQGR
ncbi:hypothetical protein L6452_38767 [Arctium lappa]|uniref:Uncharacterized protein n=1 Tax=Arctium lappa TaxID=4217 RepID=A0ACB8XQE7_ARCLA|nr:hypothetical protein L6452_38767 [Arctium lappa]